MKINGVCLAEFASAKQVDDNACLKVHTNRTDTDTPLRGVLCPVGLG